MKMRKPSLKKSIKARTTGKVKRNIKKAVNPLYGKKGMGWIKDPKKAAYNKIYHNTTVGLSDLIDEREGKPSVAQRSNTSPATWKTCGVLMKVIAVAVAVLFGLPGLFSGLYLLLVVAVVASFGLWKLGSAWTKKAKEAKEEAPAELPAEEEE